MRVYHMPEEIALALGHGTLCLMQQFEDEPVGPSSPTDMRKHAHFSTART